jgi:DNA mismatch endonuclease (patch repair protein)
MSRNRGRDTKPEVMLRKACWALGMRYTLNSKLGGRPDFVFTRSKVAVFVDGCFWHGCPVHYHAPATRADFWKTKIDRNRARDRAVTAQLSAEGWTVLRVWEHAVRSDLMSAVTLIYSTVVACVPSGLDPH